MRRPKVGAVPFYRLHDPSVVFACCTWRRPRNKLSRKRISRMAMLRGIETVKMLYGLARSGSHRPKQARFSVAGFVFIARLS